MRTVLIEHTINLMSPSPHKGPGRPPGSRGQEGSDALLRATRDLLAQSGLGGITLRAVAERAGVQPALVSYYFGSKEGLLRSVVHHVSREGRDRMQTALAQQGSVEDRLRAIIEGWMNAMAADPYAPRLMVEQVFFGDAEAIDEFVVEFVQPILDGLRALLEEGYRTGETREMDPMFFVPLLSGMCVHFFLSLPLLKRAFHLDDITPEHVRTLATHAGDLVMHGISTQVPRR